MVLRLTLRPEITVQPAEGSIAPSLRDALFDRTAEGGRVEFRNDKTGLLHVAVGKISFSDQQIFENIAALMEAVKAAKPSGAKGTYIKSVTFASTMGPGIRIDPTAAQTMSVAAS